jgi:gamma-glutamylcyclotransferase
MLYFGYGSNLWLKQMEIRCPKSSFIGLGRLLSYKWIISERGYANVVEVRNSTHTNETDDHEVWGLVYELSKSDEERLDLNEGVPYAYTKENLDVELWEPKNENKTDEFIDVSKDHQSKKMLVYIDRKRTREFKPKNEYIYRMNRGIEDALKLGVPQSYVDRVLRKFIPVDETLKEAELKQALEQAKEFRDDSWKLDA